MSESPIGQPGSVPEGVSPPASPAPTADPPSAPTTPAWPPAQQAAAQPAPAPAWAAPGAVAPVAPVAPVDPGVAAAALTTRTGSWFAGLDPRGWRTTIVVGVLMVATVLGANLANAAVPLPTEPNTPAQPIPTVPAEQPIEPPIERPPDPGPVNPGSAVEVGYGLVIFPPAGWTVVAAEPGSVALQRGGVILLVVSTPWPDDPASLADAYTQGFFSGGQFQSASPQTATLGNGIPAVVIAWSGIIDGAQYDGAIAAGAASGVGVVLNAIAPAGQLQSVAGDLDAIAATLQLVPGGQ